MNFAIVEKHDPELTPIPATSFDYQTDDVDIFTYGLNPKGDIEICLLRTFDEYDLSKGLTQLWRWAYDLGLKATCWSKVITAEEVKVEFERAMWTKLNEAYRELELIPHAKLASMVDDYVAMFPTDFEFPGMVDDWDDIINETGLAAMDYCSIGNMLTHFYHTPMAVKHNWMTYVAYKHGLDITPLALGLTPSLAALVLRDRKPE